VRDLLYGVFTEEKIPPYRGWVTFPDDNNIANQKDIITVEHGTYEHVKKGTQSLFTLRGSSNWQVNGRYIHYGFHCGAPMYKNVRDWVLVRQALKEIPEIGILASNTYQITDGALVTEQFYKAADVAYNEIVAVDSKIAAGTHQFKRRFIEIARVGSKMVNSDMTNQTDRNTNLRAYTKNKASQTKRKGQIKHKVT
jgi:hypothetical protein